MLAHWSSKILPYTEREGVSESKKEMWQISGFLSLVTKLTFGVTGRLVG